LGQGERKLAKERIKERRFKAMFIPDKCWEFVSQSLVTDAGDIMSVDAEVNDVEIIVVADELPDMLEEFKNSPDRGTAYKYVGALLVQTYKYLYTKAPLFYHVDLIFLSCYPSFCSQASSCPYVINIPLLPDTHPLPVSFNYDSPSALCNR
jgi:hypothetical protein